MNNSSIERDEQGQGVASKKLVSVIIPAYNADAHLAETLVSVGRQLYPYWEVIVVEDGSDGETKRLVDDFARGNPDHRVVYLRHDVNRGQAAARNTAIEQSRGLFLAFLDSDDIWMPDHLGLSVERLTAHRVDLVYSSSVCFDDKTGIPLGLWGPSQDEIETFPDSLFRRSFITPSATVLRRGVVTQVGPFDVDRRVQGGEDVDFWLRGVRAGIRFEHVPGVHCLYRKGHAHAATSNMDVLQPNHAFVLEKNRDIMAHAPRLRDRCLADCYAYAGHLHAADNWRKARRFYLRAWRFRPVRFDRLILGVMALWRMPISRAVRKRHAARSEPTT